MKIAAKIAVLAAVACGLASAAQAQTSITTDGAGTTVIKSNGAAITTPVIVGKPVPARRAPSRPGLAKASAPSKEVTIDGNDGSRTIDCKGNTVTVDGNNNRLLLRGTCARLNLNGNNNLVRWNGPDPVVTDLGNQNVTRHID